MMHVCFCSSPRHCGDLLRRGLASTQKFSTALWRSSAQARRQPYKLTARRVPGQLQTFSTTTSLDHASAKSQRQQRHELGDGIEEGQEVRVRFAPSPTGNLHVGGARTALFNYLFARRFNGKFVLRIEDTDRERNTPESEAAVLEDVKWLGLEWDEGPDVGGPYGPYRQSERNSIYLKAADELVAKGSVYLDFCTNEELDQMKNEAEREGRPPVYTGKWAHASEQEVQDMKAQGLPYCYRMRSPDSEEITFDDLVRGPIKFNTNDVGDFVVIRSNGQPVYNFSCAVDDHEMRISHVLRAEEHLPNTLRQEIVRKYLFGDDHEGPRTKYAHLSIIVAEDRKKLSKRHGATSVGEFRRLGFLPEAMADYLSQLGWNDGTEQQFHTLDELKHSFSMTRVGGAAAFFDMQKLLFTNGHYLRSLPQSELNDLIGQEWVRSGIIKDPHSDFAKAAAELLAPGLKHINTADQGLEDAISYPLEKTMQREESWKLWDQRIAERVIAAHDSHQLEDAVCAGQDAYAKWVKGIGKELGVKGKAMWMPFRLCLTGSTEGAELAPLMAALAKEDGDVLKEGIYVPLSERVEVLRKFVEANRDKLQD